ncbi:MAG: universal stress protein [Ekhidna sp.]
MISRILIPTDFSAASWQATKIGLEIGKVNNADVSILHIFPLVSKFSSDKKELELPVKLEQLKSKMDILSSDFNEDAKKITNVVLPGNVEHTMLKFIREHDFDLVIIGINSHGETNEMGSHTVSIIERSGTPVLIVPNNKHSNGAIAS